MSGGAPISLLWTLVIIIIVVVVIVVLLKLVFAIIAIGPIVYGDSKIHIIPVVQGIHNCPGFTQSQPHNALSISQSFR